MTSKYILVSIIGCCIVTWIPRIVPFLISKHIDFPKKILLFLSYVPICILTALLVQSILEVSEEGFPKVKTMEVFSSVPTLLIAIKTKNLMKTVIVGMITMAVLRML